MLGSAIDCTMMYQKAILFAIEAHKDQMYGKFPYISHLMSASMTATRFGCSIVDAENGIYQHCGLILHDSMEDAGVKFRSIKNEFGERVAEMVFGMTDEIGRNRKERHEKTYPKIKANKDSLFGKLCDRITNAEQSARERSRQMDMYRTEHPEFREALYIEEHKAMWDHLEKVLFPTGEKI
jgi:(p)ppGpp synthase/HD superfamily hydrolase